MTGVDRRALLKAACAGCATFGLAACGGSKAATTAATAATGGGSSAGAAGKAIATLADIPVGSSISARSPDGIALLLARPTATTVVGFNARCTHQGCTVEPSGKELGCPCHDAVYDAFTGNVLSGPAPAPLHPYPVKISGQDVVPA